jgi:hypothetical protein
MNVAPIPLNFAQGEVSLNWGDMLWGYERALLTWKDLVALARDRVGSGSEDALEIELATADKESLWKVTEYARKLADQSAASDAECRRKWLFVRLAWAYQTRNESPDPLGAVEEIYADFDYPAEIESFVRYMPPTDGYRPDQHSKEANHQRLMTAWTEYLVSSRPKRE